MSRQYGGIKLGTRGLIDAEVLLNYLRQSAVGRLLLDMAQKLNIPITISDDLPEGATGVTDYGPTRITIASDSVENMTETFTHELVHGVTAEDGDSLQEEIYATVVVEAVSSEIGLNQHIRTQADIEQWARSAPLYTDLPEESASPQLFEK